MAYNRILAYDHQAKFYLSQLQAGEDCLKSDKILAMTIVSPFLNLVFSSFKDCLKFSEPCQAPLCGILMTLHMPRWKIKQN
jgi:hypothetical protein